MNQDRDERGRFLVGHALGGPGRPAREREESYLQKLHEVCTLEEWEAICRRAVEDAKRGDPRARRWLSSYLLPRVDLGDVLPLGEIGIYASADEAAADGCAILLPDNNRRPTNGDGKP